ncbi:MAG: choice-of-anchor R domain-containing protein [Planctomycetota bacterium]
MPNRCGVLLVVIAALLVQTALADDIIGNFSAAPGTGTAFGQGSTTQYKAFGFTMPNASYYLDAVTLTITWSAVGLGEVSIWDGATLPGNQLIVLNSPNQSGSGDYAFTPPAQFTLQANQNYWVYVKALAGSPSWQWRGTSPSTMPSGLASPIGYIFNGSPSSYYNRLLVTGTPVPEPAAAVAALLAFALLRRR